MINGLNSANSVVANRTSPRESANNIRGNDNGTTGSQNVNEATRVSRVEEIKAQVESGTYQLNMNQTAQKVAESLIF